MPKCYYVISIEQPKLVESIEKDFLSTVINYKYVTTIKAFGMCKTLIEAKKFRQEVGGIILVGVEDHGLNLEEVDQSD